MVVDTSALVAILFQEPDARLYAECLEADPVRLISAANWLETQIVVNGRLGPAGGALADSFFRESRLQVVGLDAPHVHAALAAWQRFGKGRHPAALNLGDCCAYATAALRREKLLFKGGDFSRTDAVPAL